MSLNVRNLRAPVALLVLAGAVLAGCGGDDDSGTAAKPADLAVQVASIVEAESARYGELGDQVSDLDPDQPLSQSVRQQMRDLARAARRAADSLERLTPPPQASSALGELIEAFRLRAEDFEDAARRDGVTLQQLETEGDITASGERLDQALAGLREAGLLPLTETHDQPGSTRPISGALRGEAG